MPNTMIGEEKVTGRTMCFDEEDWNTLKDLSNEFGLVKNKNNKGNSGISSLIRAFLRSLENHPREIRDYVKEAVSEGRKIQSVSKIEIMRAIRSVKV